MKKMINDYAGEYEDCVEVLEKPVPEHVPVDESTIRPKVDEKFFKNVNTLFGGDEDEEEDPAFFDVQKAWGGMPVCENRNIKIFKTVVINLKTPEDMVAFSQLMKQTITVKTKSLWYPQQDTIAPSLHAWVDEEAEFGDAD